MLSIGEAGALLGVSTGRLRRWEREGKIEKVSRTLGQHRRYSLPQIQSFYELRGKDPLTLPGLSKKVICYARVSGHDQKQDLETQAARLVTWADDQGYKNIEG
jgi:predicted site-specific integrase-resolvase